MLGSRITKVMGIAVLVLLALGTNVRAENFTKDTLIVRFKSPIGGARGIAKPFDEKQFKIIRPIVPALNIYLVQIVNGTNALTATRNLKSNPNVKYSQPDHFVKLREIKAPSDTRFGDQWSLDSKNGVNISARQAWNIGQGGKTSAGEPVVMAIVDGGVDLVHRDLAQNIWVNKNEIPGNGIDDDGNGYIDDVNGWNAYDHNGKIRVADHGTHVAGIAGAKGNNSADIAGVNWDASIMAVSASSGTTSIVAEGYGYVLAQKKLYLETNGSKGANVVATNSSFGVDAADCTSGSFPVWNDLYEAMGKVGILSAAATANQNWDIDQKGDVPTACASEFIVSVTNTTQKDERYDVAGYGLKTVDLGAPGTDILSTVPGNKVREMTGTSMATPHVTGAIAFLHSVASPAFTAFYKSEPAKASLILKEIMLATVDKLPALAGMTVSGGRLNLAKAAAAIAAYGQQPGPTPTATPSATPVPPPPAPTPTPTGSRGR